MTLAEINSKFVYKTDKEQFRVEELWTGLQEIDGKLVGDCEDYVITLKNNVKKFKDSDYYYCKLSGNRHCILYKEGNVIDCNIKSIVSLEYYNKVFIVTEFSKYNWFVVASKTAFAKIYTLFNKGSNNE